MGKIKISKKDIAISYLTILSNTGLSILLLPILLIKLNSNELAIYYVIVSIQAISTVLDMGFNATFTRLIAAYTTNKSQIKLNIAIRSSQQVYRILTIILLIFFVASYFIFLKDLISNTLLKSIATEISILFFFFSSGLTMLFSFYEPILIGRGEVSTYKLGFIKSQIVNILISLALVFNGFGLLGIATGQVIGALFFRYQLFQKTKKFMSSVNIKLNNKILKSFIQENKVYAFRTALTRLSSFIGSRGLILLSANHLDPAELASFGLTFQIFSLIAALSLVYSSTKFPEFMSLYVSKDFNSLHKYFKLSNLIMVSVYVAVSIFLISFFELFSNLLSFSTNLLPDWQTLFLALIILLEAIHSNACNILAIYKDVPFFLASIVIALLIVLFLELGFYLFGSSITVVLFSVGVCNLYHNFRWPILLYQRIQSSIKNSTNERI
jgi:O-antigen/teichoic acid export membrane protein